MMCGTLDTPPMEPRQYETALRDRLSRLASTGAVLGAIFGAVSGVFATALAAVAYQLGKGAIDKVPGAIGNVMLFPFSAPVGAFVGFFIGAAAGGIVAALVRDPHAYTRRDLVRRVRIGILIPTGVFSLMLLSAALEAGELAGVLALAVVGGFAIGLGQIGAHWMIRSAAR